MARGLPDFYRGVDIAYQALAQMIVRPKYGGAQSVFGGPVVTANDDTELVSVSGKGMIYGGSVYVSHTSTQRSSLIKLSIDGAELSRQNFFTMNFFGLVKPSSHPFSLLKYDDVRFIFGAALAYGFTFETSFKVVYSEVHGITPTVSCRVAFALI